MKRLWFVVLGVTSVGAVAIVGMLLAPKPPIPTPVKRQVTSTILIPKISDAVVDRQSVKYDKSLKLLSYTAIVYGVKTVVSEQPTPDSFVDIPQVYDKVVSSMGEYKTFEVDVGTVHLTRPKELNGKQAAVLNTKGTLLFAKPEQDLSDDQWRKLFGSFDILK
jgi:hypothetical protein